MNTSLIESPAHSLVIGERLYEGKTYLLVKEEQAKDCQGCAFTWDRESSCKPGVAVGCGTNHAILVYHERFDEYIAERIARSLTGEST